MARNKYRSNGFGNVWAVLNGRAGAIRSGSIPTDVEFTVRQTERGTKAQIKSVHGKTLVWNQLFSPIGSTTIKDVAFTSYDGLIHLIGTPSSSGGRNTPIATSDIDVIQGHKYYLHNTLDRTQLFITSLSDSSKYFTGANNIVTAPFTGEGRIGINLEETSYDESGHIVIIDLTTMFGAGNEPATVADFREWFSKEFYPFSAPRMLNFTGTGIKSTGFNQLDLDSYMSTLGIAKTGGFYAETAARFLLESLNVPFPIKWLPNTEYCFYIRGYCSRGLSNFTLSVYYTDGSLQDIRFNSKSIDSVYGVSDPVKTIREVRFSYGSGGTEYFYLDSLCVSFSHSGYRNGEYEAYWSETRQLPTATYFPTGMKSAGSVYDELTPDKAITRIGSRAYEEGDENDPTVITNGTTTLYPLATPTEVAIDPPLNLSYRVEKGGTETLLPDDGTTSPFVGTIDYLIDYTGIVNALTLLRRLDLRDEDFLTIGLALIESRARAAEADQANRLSMMMASPRSAMNLDDLISDLRELLEESEEEGADEG